MKKIEGYNAFFRAFNSEIEARDWIKTMRARAEAHRTSDDDYFDGIMMGLLTRLDWLEECFDTCNHWAAVSAALAIGQCLGNADDYPELLPARKSRVGARRGGNARRIEWPSAADLYALWQESCARTPNLDDKPRAESIRRAIEKEEGERSKRQNESPRKIPGYKTIIRRIKEVGQ